MFKGVRSIKAIALFQLFALFATPIANAGDLLQWSSISSITAVSGWRSALSSNGSTIVTGKQGTGVYLSTNSGSSFTRVSSIGSGTFGVAISANGQKILAVNRDTGNFYISLDKGANWTQNSGVFGSTNYATCMSGDGSVWMNASYAGSVYTSTDDGATWSTNSTLGTANWWSCWLSNDGSKRLVLPNSGPLKISSDSGVNWSTSGTTVSGATCLSANDSATRILIGSSTNAGLYLSTNSGTGFAWNFTALSNITSCASSGDGSVLLLSTNGTGYYASLDSGAHWNLETTASAAAWNSVALSNDGTRAMLLPNASVAPFLGLNLPPTTLVLSSGSADVVTYKTATTITATSNYSGKVTFYANGKRIANCISIATVSLVATCNYKPTIHGAVVITARIVPSNISYASLTAELFRTKVTTRTNNRS